MTKLPEFSDKEILVQIKNEIGKWAFRALINGRPLEVWRRSSPHNWYIEARKSGNYLWHSDEYSPSHPNIKFFDKIEDSQYKILKYWGGDSGMPESSKYILKQHLRELGKTLL